MDQDERSAQSDEAELLAEIGRHLFQQNLRVTVQLPTDLAARALAGWQRDDVNGTLRDETSVERGIRNEAGALALIGLAIEERSRETECENVTVAIDAWQIGTALDAADRRGMLAGLTPPAPES
jgi:hypothetical protein